MGDRGGTIRSKHLPSSSGTSSNNNLSISGRGQAAMVLDEEEEEDIVDELEDLVTPYSI
jgi:nitroimidazol reductase NimA-like FMN-containing flavoprotein (pyridoxamine 5'-phosphate oxidase superfamily)